MKSPLLLTALATFLTCGAASAASIKLPEGYEPILRCEAAMNAPEFKVARKDGDFFLAAKVGSKTAMYLLDITDGDCGYSNLAPMNRDELGDLDRHVGYITIYNNEEDVEDPDTAVLTGGHISTDDRDDQECESIGEPLMYPID